MKKRPTNDDSDEFDVDEPEEFEESGSDWDPEDEEANAKKRKSRGGKSTGAKKSPNKKKKTEKEPSDDDEDEENEDEEEEGEEDEEDSEDETSGNGSFVVLKSDLQVDGNPPLWKIDGKALLQKYVPFEQDGKTLYKNTSTYSGWTQSSRIQYAAAPVTYVQQGKKEIIIEFNRDKVKLDEDATADGAKNEAQATA